MSQGPSYCNGNGGILCAWEDMIDEFMELVIIEHNRFRLEYLRETIQENNGGRSGLG